MNNRIGDNLIHFGTNEELVSALVSANVRFIVIGGLAVAWHCLTRQADDMDLLVEPSAENSKQISLALTKLQLNGFSDESFAKPGLQVPLKNHYYAELLTPSDDGPKFSELESQAVDAKLFNIPVRVASISTLIAMKQRAAQIEPAQSEKHLRDIRLLKEHDA